MRIRTIVLAALAVALPLNASGAGYFNMPTNLRQCMGFGFGPGYHAPLVLGPVWRGSVEAKPVKRVRYPFPPAGHTGFAGPSRLGQHELAYGSSSAYDPSMSTSPMTSGIPTMAPTQAAISAYDGAEIVPAPPAGR